MAVAKPELRFITCGSVDDGKSTLLGRLLYESRSIYEDQMRAVEADSRQYGTRGEAADLALVLDGLQAEREQGITIDVAYRFFSTPRRRFVVADSPGHEQYTRNMATAASTASLAVVLLDARKGVLQQTRRHTRIVSLMGIQRVALAVNKMDLVDFHSGTFERLAREYREFAKTCDIGEVVAIPVCAVDGDNVVDASARMPWHEGPTLLSYLEEVEAEAPRSARSSFRMPVQWVKRPNADFRGFSGRIAEGSVRSGDAVRVMPTGLTTRVKEIFSGLAPVEAAHAGDSVTLTLTDDVDVGRGNVLAAPDDPPQIADQLEAKLLWMGEHALMPGRPYLLKIHTQEVAASVTGIQYREDVVSGARLAAKTLALNEIGVVNVSTSLPIVFEPYAVSRTLGAFILVDKRTFETVGAGMIDYALRRAANIRWQAIETSKAARAALMRQQPRCIWLTGLSASGKSTIANLLEKRLHAAGQHTYLLDGDNVRHGLNRDLGFSEADRVENIRRVAEVARMMVDAGLIVIASFISPFRAERSMARASFAPEEFVEVFVDTPLAECERRDPKGLYAKARRGEIRNFTGIDSRYEPPEAPELTLPAGQVSAEECARRIVDWLETPRGA